MIKTICVFSSSSSAVNSVYRDTAIDLGKRLGQEGFDLTFGVADVGLMGIIARQEMHRIMEPKLLAWFLSHW